MAAIASVKVDTSGLKRVAEQLEPQARKVIAKAAFDVESRAKRRAPVDTGALRASIYTSVGGGRSSYSVTKTIAKGLGATAFTDEEKAEGLSANIGASVEYAIFNEMGSRKMGAHPFLIPALEEVRKSFEDAWKELVK